MKYPRPFDPSGCPGYSKAMIARSLCLLLALTLFAVAAGPANRNPIPDPAALISADSFSIAVVNARADDVPIQNLLKSALNSIATGQAKLPPSMAQAGDYLAQNNRADMLIDGLPFQGVRVDRLLASGQTSPTIASTLSGWRGLQVQVYNGLSADSAGKPYPSVTYRRNDLVSLPSANDPTQPGNLVKVNGTFLFTPTQAEAKTIIDRLVPKEDGSAVPNATGALASAFASLDKSADAYGVAINNKGAFSTLLKSMPNEYVDKVREKVGSDRLDKGVAAVKTATWSVNVVTEDRAECQAILKADPAQATEIAAMFTEGQQGLDATKITDASATAEGDTVTVKFAIIGLQQLMLDMMAKGFGT